MRLREVNENEQDPTRHKPSLSSVGHESVLWPLNVNKLSTLN